MQWRQKVKEFLTGPEPEPQEIPAQFLGLGARMAAPEAPKRFGALWLLAVIALSLPFFTEGFAALLSAWAQPEYSHGPLIPLISLFLFLRELAEGRQDRGPAAPSAGLIFLALSLGLALLGQAAQIPDLVAYGLILWVMALVLLTMGARGRSHWLPVLHLVFMLPLPQFLYWKLSVSLQLISSQIGVWVIRLFEIPVMLDGNVIDLGVYQLQVAEACSGLRYLFPILSFSYLFGILYRGPFLHKALLFLTAAPLTVAMNALRIGAIGVLVDRYGIAQAEGFLHIFEGWVVFLACIALLFVLATVLGRMAPEPLTLRETLDLDFDGLSGEFARLKALPARAGLVLAVPLLALALALKALWPAPAPQHVERASFAQFPRQIGAWASQDLPIGPATRQVIGADDLLSVEYATETQPVALFIAYYARQTEGEGIHSPEICLPVGGWEVAEIAPAQIGAQQVMRAVIRKGLAQQLVYYWYEQRGAQQVSDLAMKLAVLRDSLLRGRSDGALVRLSTPLAPAEEMAQAEARLGAALAQITPILPRYIPN